MTPMVIAVLFAVVQAPLQVPPPPPPPTPRPLLVEYLTAQHQAMLAGLQSHSHREVMIRHDKGEEVRTETEVSCPDGFRMRVYHGGKLTTDFYNVNGREYRQVNGAWKSSPAPRGSGRCPSPAQVRQYEAMWERGFQQQLRRADQLAASLQVVKGPIKTVRGVRCQEWQTTSVYTPGPGESFKAQMFKDAVCYDVQTHNLIERAGFGAQTIDYDWNKPIDLKPPQ